MSHSDPAGAEYWSDRVTNALDRYAEPLLREVMQRLLKPRNQWPVAELVERGTATLTNAAVVDRRLSELPASARKLLAAVGVSRQPVWRVGHLLAILACLDHAEGLSPIQALLDEGLVHPVLPDGLKSIKQFEDWLGTGGIASARLFVHPAVSDRALGEDLGLPAFPTRSFEHKGVLQSDGLEWLLRTAVAWSRVAADRLRLTQQQSLFKRDLQRFQTDEILASPFAEQLTDLADPGLFALDLAVAVDLIEVEGGELRARPAPALWTTNLLDALRNLWRSLFAIEGWDPLIGYLAPEDGAVFPSVVLPAFMVLRSLPKNQWIQAEPIAKCFVARHPSWSAKLKKKAEQATEWIERLFLGVGYPLRLIEAVQEPSGWWFRLGDVGRHLLMNERPPNLTHEFFQTMIVQPNGEMVVFRQGLTPELIGLLSRFALWKTLGSACTMELTAESVYRGLETGLTLADMQRLLEQHGTRAIPATVLDSLQRWSSKRERIAVWTSATLLEFSSTDDLEAAFTRGLVAVKLTDHIGIAAGGEEIDYRQFRLIGNRDYEAKPQKCLTFEPDGVTFAVDMAQSDLILEAELSQLAIALPESSGGPRRFKLTPESLQQARQFGYSVAQLEQWALNRSGEPLSSAARLLFAGSQTPAFYSRRLIVQLPNETVTAGIMQWPTTAGLIDEQLGPCAVIVTEANLQALQERLQAIGVDLQSLELGES